MKDEAIHFSLLDNAMSTSELGNLILTYVTDDLRDIVTMHLRGRLISQVSLAIRLMIPDTEFWDACHDPCKPAVMYCDKDSEFWLEGNSVKFEDWADVMRISEKDRLILKMKYT